MGGFVVVEKTITHVVIRELQLPNLRVMHYSIKIKNTVTQVKSPAIAISELQELQQGL